MNPYKYAVFDSTRFFRRCVCWDEAISVIHQFCRGRGVQRASILQPTGQKQRNEPLHSGAVRLARQRTCAPAAPGEIGDTRHVGGGFGRKRSPGNTAGAPPAALWWRDTRHNLSSITTSVRLRRRSTPPPSGREGPGALSAPAVFPRPVELSTSCRAGTPPVPSAWPLGEVSGRRTVVVRIDLYEGDLGDAQGAASEPFPQRLDRRWCPEARWSSAPIPW